MIITSGILFSALLGGLISGAFILSLQKMIYPDDPYERIPSDYDSQAE